MLHTKIAVVGIFALLVSPAMVEAQQNGNNNGESGQVSSNGQISSQTSNQGFVGGGGIGGDPRATSNQANMAGMGMNAMGGFGGFGGFGGMGRGMMGGMMGQPMMVVNGGWGMQPGMMGMAMSWFNPATDPWLWGIRRECRWRRRRIYSC